MREEKYYKKPTKNFHYLWIFGIDNVQNYFIFEFQNSPKKEHEYSVHLKKKNIYIYIYKPNGICDEEIKIKCA